MGRLGHRGLAALCIVALVAYASPALAGTGARLEGRVVGVDGRPAGGLDVLLVDSSGSVVRRSPLDDSGIYRFRDLPAATYAIALESAEGLAAPVLESETRVRDGELARRDVKLVEASTVNMAPAGSVGEWWAGLNRAAKAWTVVGVVLLVGAGAAALDDEDGASDYVPPQEQPQ